MIFSDLDYKGNNYFWNRNFIRTKCSVHLIIFLGLYFFKIFLMPTGIAFQVLHISSNGKFLLFILIWSLTIRLSLSLDPLSSISSLNLKRGSRLVGKLPCLNLFTSAAQFSLSHFKLAQLNENLARITIIVFTNQVSYYFYLKIFKSI